MTINKTQQFLYFQNKAKHYDTIRNIKSSVNDKLQYKYMKTLNLSNRPINQKSTQKKKPRLVPLLRQKQIKQENQHLINRLFKMFKSQRTQVNIQGNYSRYNHQQRKFRSTNPYQDELNRTIQLGNNQISQRLKKIKPKIGNSTQWTKHFGKTLSLKKNMSKYLLEQNKSKGSLHISVIDNYVPKYFDSFLNTSSVIDLNKNQNKSIPKQIQITRQGLLILPDIKSKQSHPSHQIRHTKDNKTLIFDRSKSSLHDHNKSQSSLDSSMNVENPQKSNKKNDKIQKKIQKTQKRRLLQFKFSQVITDNSRRVKNNIKKNNELKNSQSDSQLQYQKPINEQKVKQEKQQRQAEKQQNKNKLYQQKQSQSEKF